MSVKLLALRNTLLAFVNVAVIYIVSEDGVNWVKYLPV